MGERLVVSSRIESRNLTSHRTVFYVLIDRIDFRIAKSSRNILPTRSPFPLLCNDEAASSSIVFMGVSTSSGGPFDFLA